MMKSLNPIDLSLLPMVHFVRFSLLVSCFFAGTAADLLAYEVTVVSRYGANQVTPNARLDPYVTGTDLPASVDFSAPEGVYFDESFNEIGDDVAGAFYKAVPKGYSIDGANPILTGLRNVNLNIRADVRFEWVWELQYALFIESGVGGANAAPAVGKRFYTKNSIVNLEVDGRVGSNTAQASLVNYLLESGSAVGAGPGDFFAQVANPHVLSEIVDEDTFWYGDEAPHPDYSNIFGTGKEFTIEFWLRIDGEIPVFRFQEDRRDSGDDQEFDFRFGPSADGSGDLEVLIQSGGLSSPDKITLSAPKEKTGGWHHWAVIYDPPIPGGAPGVYKLYRDTLLEDQVVPDPQTRDPLLYFDELPATDSSETRWEFELGSASYNNMRFWNRSLPAAILEQVRNIDQLEGNVATELGAGWDDGHLEKEWTWNDQNEIPTALITDRLEFRNEFDPVDRISQLVPEPPTKFSTASRVDNLETIVMNDWVRVTWNWEGQVRYRFDASTFDGQQAQQLNSQPFLRVDDGPALVTGSGPNIDHWVPLGAKVEVGCYYRTSDRCLTMGEFVSNPTGDVSDGLRISQLVDTDVGGALARVLTVGSVTAPSEIHWQFEPTVFRAEVPLGRGLDLSDIGSLLVPALCSGGVLRDGRDGPGASIAVSNPRATGRSSGLPARWDPLGSSLYPVHPDTIDVDWPDQNTVGEHKIRIISGYPGETVPLSYPAEDPDGRRQISTVPSTMPVLNSAGVQAQNGGGELLFYVMKITLDGVEDSFPAAPDSHYRHLFDVVQGRRPPTKLDPSATDQWEFQEMSYTDNSTGALVGADPTVGFEATGVGRSVMLYRFRPNPDETATDDATRELLAVRVVESNPIVPVHEEDLALGRRAFQLGPEAAGLLGTGSTVVLGASQADTNFSLDFWLNVSAVPKDDVEMSLLELGDGDLNLTFNPAAETITASYENEIATTNRLPVSGNDWHHIVVQIQQDQIREFIAGTFLNLHVNGVAASNGVESSNLPAAAPSFEEAVTVGANSLRFEAGLEGVEIDVFRLFIFGADNSKLSSRELSLLRMGTSQGGDDFRGGLQPEMQFGFESAPDRDGILNISFFLGSKLGTVFGPTADGGDEWAHVNLEEVALRLESTLDRSGFGSGYILNELSNYNANLYTRGTNIGSWGPIFPVNHGRLFTDVHKKLEVAYYESPYRETLGTNAFLHPNVDWPYAVVAYDRVTFPLLGPDKDKAIYIASRIGSEGVGRNGRAQPVYALDRYEDLAVYNQPASGDPGYNPNEEHAIVAPSGRAALKVAEIDEDIDNSSPLAAFALQKDINVTSAVGYTSDPWVLVQVQNLESGKPEMAAYRVLATRAGTVDFPRPSDLVVSGIAGLEYDTATAVENAFLRMDPDGTFNFDYQFDYPVFAGDLLIPPYPLNTVIGNVPMADARGGNIRLNGISRRALWRDVNDSAWVVAG
ncbi:MAG: LamG-like jellyroll fold domain-containing protein, partial [Verrucomicrobiales bacterium]